jgi:hypothetical protein
MYKILRGKNQLSIFYFLGLVALSISVVLFPHISIALMAILVCGTALITYPKPSLLFFGVFLVFQWYFVSQLGRDTFLGTVLLQTDEMFILLSFAILIFRRMTQEGYCWGKNRIDVPLLCLIGASLLSTLFANIVPWKHSMFDLYMLLKGFMIFYIFTSIPFNEKDIRFYVNTFLLVGLFVLLVGFLDLSMGVTFKSAIHKEAFLDVRGGILSVSSIWPHPGEFGWCMAYFACFAFAFNFVFFKKRYFILGVLFSIGVVLSMRMKPIGGLSVALLCGFFAVRQNVIRNSLKVVLIVIILGLFFHEEILGLVIKTISGYIQVPDPLKIARNALYITSLRIAADYLPFGSGLGTFGGWIASLHYSPLYYKYGLSNIYGLSKGGSFTCDTFWPYIIGQFGIIGLLCYSWIVWRFFRLTLEGIRNFRSSYLKAYSLGTLLIFVEALMESLASPIFLKSPSIYFIFGALGVLSSLLSQKGKSKGNAISDRT